LERLRRRGRLVVGRGWFGGRGLSGVRVRAPTIARGAAALVAHSCRLGLFVCCYKQLLLGPVAATTVAAAPVAVVSGASGLVAGPEVALVVGRGVVGLVAGPGAGLVVGRGVVGLAVGRGVVGLVAGPAVGLVVGRGVVGLAVEPVVGPD
jgi:hypothetical protein